MARGNPYPKRYREKKNDTVTLEKLHEWMSRVREHPRKEWIEEINGRIYHRREPNFFLGVDPLRDRSLLALLYWTGLRVSEVVGDKPRRYIVQSPYAKTEEAKQRARREKPPGVPWKQFWDRYWRTTEGYYEEKYSEGNPGILKEDIVLDVSYYQTSNGDWIEVPILKITAAAKKHGERKAPLELELQWAYVDLILKQWQRTKPGEPVWGGVFHKRKEYVWKMLKEIDPTIYPHYFRFNRASKMVEDQRTNPQVLLSWFGWKRLQTAYHYLELGGKYIHESREIIRDEVKREGR